MIVYNKVTNLNKFLESLIKYKIFQSSQGSTNPPRAARGDGGHIFRSAPTVLEDWDSRGLDLKVDQAGLGCLLYCSHCLELLMT